MDREKLKHEGIERLKIIKGLMPGVIRDFERDVVNVSTSVGLDGILYWANDEQSKIIKEVEDEFGGIVYHAILSHTTIGDLLSLLWVSKDDREWIKDRQDLQENMAFCYVHNMSDTIFSEFGYIGYAPVNGGVKRIA